MFEACLEVRWTIVGVEVNPTFCQRDSVKWTEYNKIFRTGDCLQAKRINQWPTRLFDYTHMASTNGMWGWKWNLYLFDGKGCEQYSRWLYRKSSISWLCSTIKRNAEELPTEMSWNTGGGGLNAFWNWREDGGGGALTKWMSAPTCTYEGRMILLISACNVEERVLACYSPPSMILIDHDRGGSTNEIDECINMH